MNFQDVKDSAQCVLFSVVSLLAYFARVGYETNLYKNKHRTGFDGSGKCIERHLVFACMDLSYI